MSQDLVKQILAGGASVLTDLAKTMGSTAVHIYTVLVKQQVITGAISIIQLVLLGIAALIIGPRIYAWIRKYQEDKNIGGGFNWAIGLGSGIVSVVVVLNVLSILGDALNKIANPEYFAIQVILTTIKNR